MYKIIAIMVLFCFLCSFACTQEKEGSIFFFLKYKDIEKSKAKEFHFSMLDQFKKRQFEMANMAKVVEILKAHQFSTAKSEVEGEVRTKLAAENVDCLILGGMKPEGKKFFILCRVLPVWEGVPSEQFKITPENWEKASQELIERIFSSAFFKKLKEKKEAKPKEQPSDPSLTKTGPDQTKPVSPVPEKPEEKSPGQKEVVTSPAPGTKEKLPEKTKIPEDRGWFGESLPDGMRRSKAPGEYIWIKDGSLMVYVPSGEFRMGKDPLTNPQEAEDELPEHPVSLPAYYIDKYEVSNRSYCAFLNDVKKTKEGDILYLEIESPYCGISQDGDVFRPKQGAENCPVVKVTWHGALAYARWAGKRLPSEKEWEKACRGGIQVPNFKSSGIIEMIENPEEKRIYPWGDTPMNSPFFKANGKGKEDGHEWVAPVNAFEGLGDSPYGCSQMAGNVWEWVEDWYDKDAYKNPQGQDVTDGKGKVCRGGSWGSEPMALRCSYRYASSPEKGNNDLGFRCALSFPDTKENSENENHENKE